MSGGASRSWLEDAAARARFVAVVELEGVGADDADSATRLDESVAFARPRRGPARFSRIQAWVFPLVIVVGFAAMHAARVVPSAAGEDADESSARSLVMQSKFRSVAAGVVAVAGLACAGVAVGDAVEWRVEDGGNGHWYARIVRDSRTWSAMQALAEGFGGHLATVTSPGESAFLVINVLDGSFCFVGGFQPVDAPEPAADWRWVTGEPPSWTNWADGEPNNYAPSVNEDVMAVWGDGKWADVNEDAYLTPCNHAIIEWSADCNNNGVVDFGEIRNGLAVDTNGNNIPDECECANDPSLAICCPEDIIEDGAVNAIDLAAILNTWGTDGGKFPRADVDGSGTVDGADLAAVLSAWGPCE